MKTNMTAEEHRLRYVVLAGTKAEFYRWLRENGVDIYEAVWARSSDDIRGLCLRDAELAHAGTWYMAPLERLQSIVAVFQAGKRR